MPVLSRVCGDPRSDLCFARNGAVPAESSARHECENRRRRLGRYWSGTVASTSSASGTGQTQMSGIVPTRQRREHRHRRLLPSASGSQRVCLGPAPSGPASRATCTLTVLGRTNSSSAVTGRRTWLHVARNDTAALGRAPRVGRSRRRVASAREDPDRRAGLAGRTAVVAFSVLTPCILDACPRSEVPECWPESQRSTNYRTV
jgi:hypothetical protein